MHSFYWFDFETFGVNPAKDRPSQFAGIRTNSDFEIIDEPLNIFCRPADDFLPHPEACLVTGITPQQALEQGISERDFFRQIHMELSTPETCAVGYNNIRFDDEVVRFGLYRNFYDAYAREWQDNNSRWDILDLLRMTHALRPEGIEWPLNHEGNPSFRLEHLTVANGIKHVDAHDALADVYATIEMAKLVKHHQPKLFEYLFELRDKRRVMAEINLSTLKPFVHCSGMLGAKHNYCAVMMPIVAHPINKNSVICIDLTKPYEDISQLDKATIESRLFTRTEDLAPGINRIPIKEIHYNKCPAVAPIGVLNEKAQTRLNIDLEACLKKAEKLKQQIKILQGKLITIYQNNIYEPINNPDHALYSGGFFKPSDKSKMQKIRRSNWEELANNTFNFDDGRLNEMLFRYRARNAPDSLSAEEIRRWNQFKKDNYFDENSGSTLTYSNFIEKISLLKQDKNNNQEILIALESYGNNLISQLEQN
ncbi:exodeoxyribonuclease I [Aliikangiella sp. IMCC44359]|uniref:exodeoxyribonuclease I n=1 Tax=Aliikangiella sp. IMCC44359 TaxID=3459125 RepID=UPI00403AAB1F